MKINNVECMITKVEVKENKEKVQYIFLNMVDVASGDMFEIVEKDMTMLGQFKPFIKVKCNFNLLSSKYGLQLKLVDIVG